MVSNVNLVTSSGITGSSTVQVKTPLLKDVNVGDQATLSLDGGIDGGTVQGESTVTVSGDISGAVSAKDQSTISAGAEFLLEYFLHLRNCERWRRKYHQHLKLRQRSHHWLLSFL